MISKGLLQVVLHASLVLLGLGLVLVDEVNLLGLLLLVPNVEVGIE